MDSGPLSSEDLAEILYTGIRAHAKLATPRRADVGAEQRDREVAARVLAERLAQYLATCRVTATQAPPPPPHSAPRFMLPDGG